MGSAGGAATVGGVVTVGGASGVGGGAAGGDAEGNVVGGGVGALGLAGRAPQSQRS